MPSLSARLVGFVLRTTGLYRKMFAGGPLFRETLAKIRMARLAEPSAKMKAKLDVSQAEFQGQPVWKITPKNRAPTAHILYWHGGGYVYPAAPVHWAFLAGMAERYGWSVTAPLYPLAPESDAERTTAFALEFYRSYAAAQGGTPFLMAGDSAGGGLAAATALLARDGGLPLPKGMILICPWLNLDPAHPDQKRIEPRDAILSVSGISEAGMLYAGTLALDDPRASPIFGDWGGLGPILAFGGGDDILVTDARALVAKLPSVDYVEEAGMIHVWPIFTFPESRRAQTRMADFAQSLL